MDHKNQHWIPKGYLKAWCDPAHRDKVVHVYGAGGDYRGWKPYSRIFSADDLYTVTENGERDLRTEKGFQVLEDEFIKVRRAIDRGRSLPAASKRTLAYYTAAMRNRSPRSRDHWQSFTNRIVQVGEGMKAAAAKMTPAEREKWSRSPTLRGSDLARSMSLEDAQEAANEPFGRSVVRHIAIEGGLLEKMSFAIMKAPDGSQFITSDNPVVWHGAGSGEGRHIGLGHQDIEVSMPITPRYCLLFDHLGKDGTCDVGQRTVDEFNSRVLRSCDAHFIAQSGDLVVEWAERG